MTIEEVNATHHLRSCRHGPTVIGALHAACIVNNTTAVVTLLRIDGIKLNQTIGGVSCSDCDLGGVFWGSSYSGLTPIVIAAHKKHKETFELLVQDDRVNLKAVVKMLGAMTRQEKQEIPISEQHQTPLLDILKDLTTIDMEPAVVKFFLKFIYTGEVSSEDLKENVMK